MLIKLQYNILAQKLFPFLKRGGVGGLVKGIKFRYRYKVIALWDFHWVELSLYSKTILHHPCYRLINIKKYHVEPLHNFIAGTAQQQQPPPRACGDREDFGEICECSAAVTISHDDDDLDLRSDCVVGTPLTQFSYLLLPSMWNFYLLNQRNGEEKKISKETVRYMCVL